MHRTRQRERVHETVHEVATRDHLTKWCRATHKKVGVYVYVCMCVCVCIGRCRCGMVCVFAYLLFNIMKRVGVYHREAENEDVCVWKACSCANGFIVLLTWTEEDVREKGGERHGVGMRRKTKSEVSKRACKWWMVPLNKVAEVPAVSQRITLTNSPSTSSMAEKLSNMVGM